MREFIIVVFDDEARAEAGLVTLGELHRDHAIELRTVGVAAKDEHGNLSLRDAVGKGAPNALAGAAIGGVIGLLGGPVGALAGAAGGGFIGSWRDMTRLGIGAELLEQVTTALQPGKSAVIAEVTDNTGSIESRLRALGGEVFREHTGEVADRSAALETRRAEAAERGETLPSDDQRQQLVKGRPAKSAHP